MVILEHNSRFTWQKLYYIPENDLRLHAYMAQGRDVLGYMLEDGVEEDSRCNRDDCEGRMFLHPVRGCTCFIDPPCSRCVDNAPGCLKCDRPYDWYYDY